MFVGCGYKDRIIITPAIGKYAFVLFIILGSYYAKYKRDIQVLCLSRYIYIYLGFYTCILYILSYDKSNIFLQLCYRISVRIYNLFICSLQTIQSKTYNLKTSNFKPRSTININHEFCFMHFIGLYSTSNLRQLRAVTQLYCKKKYINYSQAIKCRCVQLFVLAGKRDINNFYNRSPG